MERRHGKGWRAKGSTNTFFYMRKVVIDEVLRRKPHHGGSAALAITELDDMMRLEGWRSLDKLAKALKAAAKRRRDGLG